MKHALKSFAATAILLSSATHSAELVVDNVAKLNLFYQSSSTSLHTTGDLEYYSPTAHLLKAPLSHTGWANFTGSGLPWPGPSVINPNYSKVDDGHCVTFVERMTNTCGMVTSNYIKGRKVTDQYNASTLTGKAIATFDCNNKFCQDHVNRKYGHIAIVLSAEYSSNGKIQEAWVVDSNTLPYYGLGLDGGSIAKRKMLFNELNRYHVVEHTRNLNNVKCCWQNITTLIMTSLIRGKFLSHKLSIIMKKILLFAGMFIVTIPQIYAADYTFYDPITTEFSYRPEFGSEISIGGPDLNFGAVYTNIENASFRSFPQYKFFCLAAEKDGMTIGNWIQTEIPFAEYVTDRPHYSDEKFNEFIATITRVFPFFDGTINNQTKKIANVSKFAGPANQHLLTQICRPTDKSGKILERGNFLKSLRSGDTVTHNIQYSVGTSVETRFLSPFAPLQKSTVISNFASHAGTLETLRIDPKFLCFKNDQCNVSVEKIEKIDLADNRSDITNTVLATVNKSEWYDMYDRWFSVPVDTKALIFTYR